MPVLVGEINPDGTCSSCGAPILWGKRAGGGRIPLNPEPILGGNIELLDDGVVRFLTRVDVEEARESGERLYVTHFATCPDAEKHRRR